jgi:NADPH:quinone reductase-like Zn-dependent oxidoreductase
LGENAELNNKASCDDHGEFMSASWLGPIKQISYTTDHLERLVHFWEAQVRVGPWNIYRGLTLNMRYEGKPIALPFHVALSMHGDTVIEIIQVLGHGPSPFHDALNRPIIGLQRLASISDNIDEDSKAAVAQGMEQFADGVDITGQRYRYFRSADAPGVILELLEAVPSFNDFLSRLEARARGYSKAAADTFRATEDRVESAPAQKNALMKAAQIRAYGGPEQFLIEDVPEPYPGPGQIRIKIAAAAVNPVDVKSRRGYLKEWMPLVFPARLGGDVAGIVDAVGAGVSQFHIGDRVMGMTNPMMDGAYAEKIVFYATSFVHVPETLDLIEAAALPTGALTGTQLIEHGLQPRPGSRGLVAGAGGSSGRAAVLAALDAGAVVYAGVRASSCDAVKDLPVAGVVDLSNDSALSAAGPFDFLADTVGGETAEKLFVHVKPDGVVASTAFPPPNPPPASTQRFVSLVVKFDGPRLERFARELTSKNRRMPVAHTLGLADVAHAHMLMERGGVGGKILLVP